MLNLGATGKMTFKKYLKEVFMDTQPGTGQGQTHSLSCKNYVQKSGYSGSCRTGCETKSISPGTYCPYTTDTETTCSCYKY